VNNYDLTTHKLTKIAKCTTVEEHETTSSDIPNENKCKYTSVHATSSTGTQEAQQAK